MRLIAMKKNLSAVIAGIACVLLAFNSIKIIRLQEEIDRLRADMNDEIHMVSRNMDGIYGEVQDMLEEEADQLAISEWKYGDINIEERTAEIICTIVPKVYTPNHTQTAIVCNRQEYALPYTDGKYTASIEVPLFERSEANMVRLNDDGTIRTQELDWIIEPRYEALLLCHAGLGGSAAGKKGEGEYIWSPTGTVVIDIEGKREFQIQSAALVEVLDGKEVNRIPIDLSREGQEAYRDALSKTGEPVPEVASQAVNHDGSIHESIVHFLYCLDKDYSIPNGGMLELYVDVVEEMGFRYRSFVECMAVTAEGKIDDLRMEEKQMYAFAEAVMIFDETGKVIFELNPELFR